MAQFFHIHPGNPQPRLIKEAVSIVRDGGIIVYPTDSAYAFGCQLGDKKALDRIRQIRQLDEKHHLTLMCRDLSEISTYAQVDNSTYRLLKAHTPGAYTFLLKATKEVPKRLLHPKRKTIGIRIPDCPIALALLRELNEPMMSTTAILPNQIDPLYNPDKIYDEIGNQVDLVIDGDVCDIRPTSIIDLYGSMPIVLRVGKGDVSKISR